MRETKRLAKFLILFRKVCYLAIDDSCVLLLSFSGRRFIKTANRSFPCIKDIEMIVENTSKKKFQTRNTRSGNRFTPVAAACALLCALSAGNVFAADIVYTGNPGDLQTIPAGYDTVSNQPNAVFPGTGTPEESNNSVMVDVASGGTNPAYVFGGLSAQLNATAGSNNVEIVKAIVSEDVNGGYAYSDGQNGHSANMIYAETVNNRVTIGNGTQINGAVYGGNAVAAHQPGNTGSVNLNSDSNRSR